MIIYNPMTPKEATSPFLVMFTVVCALPAAAGVALIPSVFAQEEDDEAENLASDTVSNVLDNVNTAEDDTNTEVSVPITDIDQTAANFGLSEALDVTVERTLSPEEEEPPEEDGVFCLQTLSGQIFCFDTSEACETAEGLVIVQTGCEEFETPPAGAISCSIVEGKIECEV